MKKLDQDKKKKFFESLNSTPQTLEEAKAKNTNLVILAAIVFAVFTPLLIIFLFPIGLIGVAILLGALVFFKITLDTQSKRNFCSQCGARINYQEGVAWEVVETSDKDCNVNQNSNSKEICRKKIATVKFSCTCLECGNAKEFTKNFTVAEWYTDGTLKEYNLETMAKGYFYKS